jgi:hypothetical protein
MNQFNNLINLSGNIRSELEQILEATFIIASHKRRVWERAKLAGAFGACGKSVNRRGRKDAKILKISFEKVNLLFVMNNK